LFGLEETQMSRITMEIPDETLLALKISEEA
jgi:hypothetical protein